LIPIDGVRELIYGGRNLQSGEEDSLLSLNTNVLGPLHKASEISLGLDVTSNSKVTRILHE